MEPFVREKQITRTSIIGILTNIVLVGFKAFVGLLSGSIAIILDAVNNLTDALSSIITIVGVKLARRKPDSKHPFGHGRIEYFSAIIISGIVITAGIMSFKESFEKIFEPLLPDFSAVSIVIIVVALIVKLLLGLFVKKQGEKYNSDALVASGKDALFDAVISAATLVGAIVAMIFSVSIDGYLGVVIACFIIKAGVEMLLDSVSSIVGKRPDGETTKAIRQVVSSFDGVYGAYDLILHNYGPETAIGSVHIEIPDTMNAGEIDKLSKEIQYAVYEKFKVILTVGVYAIDEAHKEERKQINDYAMAHDGVLETHGIFIDDEKKIVSFDVVADFGIEDYKALEEDIAEHVREMLPGYGIYINFDTNYSD